MQFVASLLLVGSSLTSSCREITIASRFFGSMNFTLLSISTTSVLKGQSGRPVYSYKKSDGLYLYLYFTEFGRWIMGSDLAHSSDGIAYIDSWAVTPYLTNEVTDTDNKAAIWTVYTNDRWEKDDSFAVTCEWDETVYFDRQGLDRDQLSGFYVLSVSDSFAGPLYMQVRAKSDTRRLFLYPIIGDRQWMIGSEIGEDIGYAYIRSDASKASNLTATISRGLDWHVLDAEEINSNNNPHWVRQSESTIISRYVKMSDSVDSNENIVATANIYEALRFVRAIDFLPEGQTYYTLRNAIPMPAIGLGTGGLPGGEECARIIESSLRLGYRLFDLAREYGNEHVMPAVLKNIALSESIFRDDIFIETKVWPTQLGFNATSQAIADSLRELGTGYIDLYLIHWPKCDPDISWMHCESTVDPEGTWEGTWKALEKAYAEGKLNAIGVSNFDISLLQRFTTDEFSVKPHVVQNWAEPGSVDRAVVDWCDANKVIFQPYASLRNLDTLQSSRHREVKQTLERVAKEHAVSQHAVALRFLIQADFAAIPRSSDDDHLKENLEVFSWELLSEDMESLWADHEG